MTANLIRNPGFENDWADDKSHQCLILPVGGAPYYADLGNIFTPSGGWITWFRHDPDVWDQPEVRDAWITGDPRRVHSGNKAILLFTFYRAHSAGFYQVVNVPENAHLKLSAWATAWSNHDKAGFPYPDDPYWSEGTPIVGRSSVTLLPHQIPPLNGDAQNDAIGNFAFTLGIDVTGGTNPLSSDVVWGTSVANYNAHFPVPAVEATALGNTVTVFLHSQTMWKFKHSDAYWDDTSLTVMDDPPPPPDCNTARVPYSRTYVLLPPDATIEETHAKVDRYFDERRTIGYSADDAGIGDGLEERNVIAVRPEAWTGNAQDLWDFYDLYYPGTNYQAENGAGDLLLCQVNDEWADQPFGDENCGSRVGEQGCFITNLAMAQRFYSINSLATPASVNEALGPEGYIGCISNWAGKPDLYANALNLSVSLGQTIVEVNDHLRSGGCVLAEVSPATYEHFVFVTKYEDGRYWMYDPWKCLEGWLDDHYSGIDSWRIVTVSQPPPPPNTTQGYIGLHLQTLVGGWDNYVRELQPGVMKFFSVEETLTCRLLSPDTTVIFRQWVANQEVYLQGGADSFIDLFRDSLYNICQQFAEHQPAFSTPYFYIESLNETYATNDPDMQRFIDFDMDFIEALARTGLPVAPVVYCAAPGNIGEHEYNKLLPLGRLCEQHGGAMGYHNYWWANQTETGVESWWQWHAGRWQGLDDYFRANGIHVKYFGGESGAVGSVDGKHLNPVAGWMSPECYNGDWNRYLTDILDLDWRCHLWNQQHGGRYLGSVLFTSGDGCGWESFQIRDQQMRAIAAALNERYS